jgi:hypothetical protein
MDPGTGQMKRVAWFFLILFFLLMLSACLPNKKLTVASTAGLLEDVAKSSYRQSDLKLVREGMPAYLMLMDGMVAAWPGNDRLLLAAAQSYASYASGFVEGQDENYARALYARARDYALKSLAQRGLQEPVATPFESFQEQVHKMGQDDVPYLFWSAACWGNWIRLNLESMEAMAQLPRVETMMKRVLALDEGYYYGGPHVFMGIWYASRPKMAGGDLAKAHDHFLKAIELGQGKFLMTYVYYADQYARRVFDKQLFVSTLQKVIDTPADILPELTLLNTIAHDRAQTLLQQVNEYFD